MYVLIYTYVLILFFLMSVMYIGYCIKKTIFHDSFENSSKSIYVSLMLGLITTVTIYSLFATKLTSVNLGFLIMALVYVLFFHKRFHFEIQFLFRPFKLIKTNFKDLLMIIIIPIILLIIYSLSVYDFENHLFCNTYTDWTFYAKTIQYLNLGFENTNQFDNFSSNNTSISPYHFFELWIAAIFSKIGNLPSQISVNLGMPAILGTIYFFAINSFSKNKRFINILLSLTLVFITYFPFSNYPIALISKLGLDNYFLKTIGVGLNVVQMPKLYTYGLFFSLSVILYSEKKVFEAFVFLLMLPFATIVAFPTVFALGLFILLIVLYKNKFSLKNKTNIRFLATFFVFLLSIISYIKLSSNSSSSESFFRFIDIKTHLSFIAQPLVYIISYFPFILLILIYRKKIIKQIPIFRNVFIFGIIIFLVGLSVGIVTVSNYDGYQFFMNSSVPMINVILAFGLMTILSCPETKYKVVLIPSVFVLLMFNVKASLNKISNFREINKDLEYNKSVIDYFKGHNGKIYCAVLHNEEFYSKTYFHSIPNVFTYADFLLSYKNDFFTIVMSDFVSQDFYMNKFDGKEIERKRALGRINEGSFFKYVEKQKNSNTFISIEKSQLSFILENKIDFIFIAKGVNVTSTLNKFIDLQIIGGENNYNLYKINRNKI